MSIPNRAQGRNVHIYAASDSTEVLGGLILTNGMTSANLYSMVEIILIFTSSDHFLRDECGNVVGRDNHPLQPGKYYVVTSGPFSVSTETWLVCTISVAGGTCMAVFCDDVCERDRRCVITGEEALDAEFGIWRGFEAAHIFPPAFEGQWTEHNMALTADAHALFDGYDVSANPDDNYKIVCFRRDRKGIAGRQLHQRFFEDPHRPVDQLLRWHFRQAVLANMRSAGEPIFEIDFLLGSDMIGEILSGPKPGERMEYELFSCPEQSHELEKKAFVIN